MICKLNRNISLQTSSSSDWCNSIEVNVGLYDGLYIYNLDDVQKLIFSGDSRPDGSLYVETVVTSEPYYKIDASDVSYTQTYLDHSYEHSLTFNIQSVREEIEEILQHALKGKYLVAFRVIGEEYYRLVGWREGLALKEELSIASDSNQFSLTLEGVTTYPILSVDSDNFKLADKVFDGMYVPLFDGTSICLGDGWAVAAYAVYVNSAGEPLDVNGKLIEYSHEKQAAYKYSGQTDRDYNIVGVYDEDAVFNGKKVKIFDSTICNIDGIISLTPSTINFTSTFTEDEVQLEVSHNWHAEQSSSFINVRSGGSGYWDLEVTSDGVCGTEYVTFTNDVTHQTAVLTINKNIITANDSYRYVYPSSSSTVNVTIEPIVCGAYSASTDRGTVVVNEDGTFTLSGFTAGTDRETHVTLTQGSETKVITIYTSSIVQEAVWEVIGEWCQTQPTDNYNGNTI